MQHSVFGIDIENFGKSATHRRRNVPLLHIYIYIYSYFAVAISIKWFGFMLSKYIVVYGTISGILFVFV